MAKTKNDIIPVQNLETHVSLLHIKGVDDSPIANAVSGVMRSGCDVATVISGCCNTLSVSVARLVSEEPKGKTLKIARALRSALVQDIVVLDKFIATAAGSDKSKEK